MLKWKRLRRFAHHCPLQLLPGAWPWWWSRKTPISCPLTGTPKWQILTEQLLITQTRTYQGRPSTTKDVKKEQRWHKPKGWVTAQPSPTPLGVGGEQPTNGGTTTLQKFPHSRNKRSEPILRSPAWGSCARKTHPWNVWLKRPIGLT